MSYTPKNNFNLQLIETDVSVPVYTPENTSNLQLGRTGIGKKGFRKKLLADVACCDNLKGYEYYGGFPLETSLEFSRDMAIYGGCPNFSWEVIDSVYFTFAHVTTVGRTNTVNADPTVPIDAEELAIVEDNCGHQLVFLILYCGGGISIIPLSPIPPDPPDDPPYDPPWPPSIGSGSGWGGGGGGDSGCNCDGIEIGYTSQQMGVDEVQTLWVVGGILRCTYIYRWDIISGGGSLSSNYGQTVIYTAPSFNGDCEQNPVISLSVYGNVCDTLAIAVTAVFTYVAYYRVTDTSCSTTHFCQESYRRLTCDNRDVGGSARSCWNGPWEECLDQEYCHEFCPPIGYVYDIRTEEQKAAGCCPAGLL